MNRPIPTLTTKDLQRFRSKVRVRHEDACWPWLAGTVKGYGQFDLAGRPFKAQRVAWFVAFGTQPGESCVCHECDNPLCCNPKHLWLGSNARNTADKVTKLRQARGARLAASIRPKALRGEVAPPAKLTSDQVIEMRRRRAAGETYVSLGRSFGVSAVAARKAVIGRSWRHVG